MGNILREWLPIVFSGIALIISMFNIYKSSKNNKNMKEYRTWKSDFDEYKEKIRQQEKQNDIIMLKLNSRASLIPYFHLLLDDSNIVFGKNNIILRITLINVGKECATNIQLYLTNSEWVLEKYIKVENLSKCYALPKETINFSVRKAVSKEFYSRLSNYIQFNIRFYDLIGNLYEQKFIIGYDEKQGFSRDNYSYLPKFIEDKFS